ncbi:MAG TPA: GNAT family N-acetyltransferase [Nocardioidaceae bacterium]|jgi:GNAT superfamily N-acetyltransferase
MQVLPIDHTDTALLARFHDVCRRAELHERPWESIWSPAELRARLEYPDGRERYDLLGAFHGDVLAGGAVVDVPLLDNTDKVYFHVMVAPEHRRRGAGSLLLAHVAELARREGRTMLLGESSYRFEERDSHGYRRFAERNGMAEVHTEVVRTLGLPVPGERLDRLSAEAAPHHADYAVHTFVDDVPERLLPSYCHLHNQLALDAPTGEVEFEAESMSPETFRTSQQRMKAAGQTRLTTVAVTAEQEVVAYTDLAVERDPRERVQQRGTLVHRAHRGHRLGTTVKVANLAALQREFPDRTEVVTWNAEDNQNMVDINERLGFRPVAVAPTFRRLL